ncbi:hypothetical protein [Streptomyces anandii]|uniref:hypothetical protein n=1 Tax=Streptomyces anandii TaxID=285454 RepID=UPI0037982A05
MTSHARRHWTVTLVSDLALGSRLLVRTAITHGRRLHATIRHLTGGARPARAAAATAKESGKDGQQEQPVPESNEKPAKPGSDTVKSRVGKRKADAGRRGWTLDSAGFGGVIAWGGWCFIHRPLEHGWHALAPDLAALLPWALVWWTAAAWLVAQHEKHRQATAVPETGAEQAAADTSVQEAPAPEQVRRAERWFRRLVVTRVAAAVAQGRRGVHLKALLEEAGIPEEWTVTTLREHCERLGIPTKQIQIRGSGGGPTWGVHVDDLTRALGMPLEQGVALYSDPTCATSPSALPDPAVEEPSGGSVAPSPGPGSRGLLARLRAALSGRPTSPARTPTSAPLPDPSPAPPEGR